MQKIELQKEVYEELHEIQEEEYEDESHLCERKLEVLFENNVEAGGALGFLLEHYDPFSGSDRSHNTVLGFHNEGSETWDGLVVSCFDNDDKELFDTYLVKVI